MTDKIQSMSDALKTNNQRANPSPSNETSALPATLTSSSTSNPPRTGVSTATASAPPIAKPTSSKRTRSQKATKDPSDAAVDKVTPALTGTSLTEAPTETDPATAVMASRISLDAGKALLSLPKPVSAPFSLLSSSLTHRPSSSPLPPLDDSDDTENEIHIKEAKQIASTKSAFAAYKIPKLSTESSDAAEWDDEAIAKLVERAIASAKAGNHEESDLYFSMYRSVSTMKKPAAIVSRAQEIVEVSSGEESEAGDLQFADEAMPRHDKMGFTPYFDKNIRTLKGPIPLTIFNKAWKDRAIIYHMEKRPKSDEASLDRSRYTGLPYPSEWAQSFSDWTQNHQGFYSTLKVEYKFNKFAKWLQMHKANCDALIAEDGFLVALRYDIQVRTNAFAHRVVLADGSTSLANISVFRPKIAHSCYATARKNGELEFTDNPYAEGGARAHWDPTTGAPKQSDRRTAPQKTPAPAQSTSTANLPAKPIKAPRGGGYKGSNFIENYKPVQSSFQGSKPAFESRAIDKGLPTSDPTGNSLERATTPPEEMSLSRPLQDHVSSWPSKVKCEMNIEEWSLALSSAGLLPEFEDVLLGFKKGFHQGIPQHTLGPTIPFFTPPNHTSAWHA
ncbi:hypothetical protein PSHT_02442 [Puccinia striiformis]|uniref:Uncharacterized protein n=1 Tax=Puccinia striiformis TaxID=27350 RepID=A0A2S4WHX5_9BASI|nr:hypothetical protein PSHT_02442 [Puccinia striiformis]